MENMLSIIIGVVCIIIGLSNRKGHISMLHSYHRNRVSEEDRLPFGKLVGLGMILVGISLIAMGVLGYLATLLERPTFMVAGTVTLVVGLVCGLGISFYAMIKYNKGIF